MKYAKICKNCKKPFTAKFHWAKYCSLDCYHEFNRKIKRPVDTRRKCDLCGILLTTEDSGEYCGKCLLEKESFSENDNKCWICGGEIDGFNLYHYKIYGRQHKHCKYDNDK